MPLNDLIISDRSLLSAICSGHYIELSQQYFFFLSSWQYKSKKEVLEMQDEFNESIAKIVFEKETLVK